MEPANRGLTLSPGSRSLSLCFARQAQTKQRGDQQRRLRSIAANRIAGDEHDSTPAARCGDDPSLIRSGPEQRRRESRDGSGHRGAEAAFTARLRTREKPHLDCFRRRLPCSTLAAESKNHQDCVVESIVDLQGAWLQAVRHKSGCRIAPDGPMIGGGDGQTDILNTFGRMGEHVCKQRRAKASAARRPASTNRPKSVPLCRSWGASDT